MLRCWCWLTAAETRHDRTAEASEACRQQARRRARQARPVSRLNEMLNCEVQLSTCRCGLMYEYATRALPSCCRFLYDLAQIPCFADRCFCLIFQSTFSEQLGSVENRLNNVKSTCQVLSSRCVRFSLADISGDCVLV